MEIRQVIGAKVKAGRKASKLTQEELADRISKTPKTISNIERGKEFPTIDTLHQISRALKVPMAEFFENIGRAKSKRRLELEIEGRELLRSMKDADLKLAIAQIRLIIVRE